MRIEPYTVGSFVHVIKRGARGLDIVRDDADKWRFLLMLNHFNDKFHSESWFRDLMDEKIANTLHRASSWPSKNSIVSIEAFTLLQNHFHLILRETQEGGVTRFMRKLGTGMANHFNSKYSEKGGLFQGAFRLKTITEDSYLRYVAVYVMVKNTFELAPGGLAKAISSFEEVWKWAIQYPYSSLGHYAGVFETPILLHPFLKELFPRPSELKSFAKDVILGRAGFSFPFSGDDFE